MCRWRRRSISVLMARSGYPKHPGLRAGLPGGEGGEAGAKLPLDSDDPGRGERGGSEQRLAQTEGAVDGRRGGGAYPGVRGFGRVRGGAIRGLGGREADGEGGVAARDRGLLQDERSE